MTLSTFLRTNGAFIILVVVIFFTLLTLFSILGVTFTPIEDKHIQKVVTIESFADSDFSDGLCEKYSAEPHEIESKCRELTEDNCNSTSCCVWLNGQTCVGGNKNGPTYHSDGDKDIDVSYYHHKKYLQRRLSKRRRLYNVQRIEVSRVQATPSPTDADCRRARLQ